MTVHPLRYFLAALRASLFARRNYIHAPRAWAEKHWRRFLHDRDGYQWWVSSDEEHFQGPYATRDDAIDTAVREGLGDGFNRVEGCQRFYIIEACQNPIQLHYYIDADDILERVCERIDEEHGGEDGMDWDFWTAAQESELCDMLSQTVKSWQHAHGIEVRGWMFTHTRHSETYTAVHSDPADSSLRP